MNEREKSIVAAALHLNRINKDRGFVPEYELAIMISGPHPSPLSVEELRKIRDIVQGG